ncbi:MAG TPA: hypothetical protein VFJ16_15005 [Longimicrobium sp.]|nr:hypothetical protein [Longimicrobium sp.]
MHLLGREGGWPFQQALWRYFQSGTVRVHSPADGEWQRTYVLMSDYHDTPMDLADASLVAASEALRQRRVFTVDRHFHIYRQQQGQTFEVVP